MNRSKCVWCCKREGVSYRFNLSGEKLWMCRRCIEIYDLGRDVALSEQSKGEKEDGKR